MLTPSKCLHSSGVLPSSPLPYVSDEANGYVVSLGKQPCGYGAFQSPDFSHIVCGEFRQRSSLGVDGNRDRLQVVRIPAPTNAAQVVKDQAIGHGTIGLFPCNDVSLPDSAINKHAAVPSAVDCPYPQVAWRLVAHINDFVGRSGQPFVMVRQITNVLASNQPAFLRRLAGKWSHSTTSAHAQTGRIRRVAFDLLHGKGCASLTAMNGSGVVSGDGKHVAANRARAFADGRVTARHSLTSYIGLGVRRAGDVPPSPGFSLPQLYPGGSYAE